MKRIVYLITFLTFNGYYAILALTIAAGMMDVTRFVTIPLRLGSSFLMIYSICKNFKNFKYKYINLLFILFWLLYLFKVLYHYNEGYSLFRTPLEYVLYAINFSVLPFLFYSSINFKQYKTTIVSALISSGFVLGLVCFFLYGEYLGSDVGRLGTGDTDGEVLGPLALSYGSVITIAMCFFQLFFVKNLKKMYSIYLFVSIVLSFIMFLLGASRGSVLAIVISMIVMVVYGNTKTKLKFSIITLVLTPVVIWSVISSGSIVFSRTESTFESGDIGRVTLWNDAFNEFLNYPLLGNRIEIGFYPHNFILETGMALGIIGLILLFIILIYGLFLIYKKIRIDNDYIWVLMLFLQGFAQHSFTGAIYFSVMLFFPLGLMYSVCDNKEKRN